MAGHRIQLRGPWECKALAQGPVESFPTRVRMPCSWEAGFQEYRGPVRLTRVFHRPTNLLATDVIRLIVVAAGASGTVTVNEMQVGEISPQSGETAFVIGALLRPSNLIVMDFSAAPDDGSRLLWQIVAIEISSIAS